MHEILKRPFRKRELFLLLVLTVLLLGLLYYCFIHQPVERRIQAADTAEIENSILTEQQKQQRIRSMQQEMTESGGESGSYVPTYNNFNEEANLLNAIFGSAASYHFTYHEPEAEDDVVRRRIDISFTAGSYAEVHEMLLQLKASPYRLLIQDVSLSAGGSTAIDGALPGLQSSSEISGSLGITFYETLYDAETTDGLKQNGGSSTGSGGLAGGDFSNLERSDLETIAESWASDVVNGKS